MERTRSSWAGRVADQLMGISVAAQRAIRDERVSVVCTAFPPRGCTGVAPAQSSGKLGQQSSEKQVEWGTNRGVPPLITTRKMGTLENRAGSIADGGEVLRAALARALESAEFHQSPRMSQLFRYL